MSEQASHQTEALRLRSAIAEVRADLLGALEKGKVLQPGELNELRQHVREAIADYERSAALLKQEERAQLERQVIDLRRLSALLPQNMSGTAVARTEFRGSGQPFIERRPPPQSRTVYSPPPRGEEGRKRPGDEIEAWCGHCGDLRLHNIVALVGDEPKKVVCQTCGARHGFRLTPARGRKGDEEKPRAAAPIAKRKTPEQLEEERRMKERERLAAELAAVENVLGFDPKRRYRGGDVIDHPEYGRGRIENVVRSSILVRFPSGLRSLMLK